MTLLSYLRDVWEGFPIYFNTIKYDDYFRNIVPFMLKNTVIKYEEDKNYNNKGDLFITDNSLLVEKAKKENFTIILIGELFKEGIEISKNIRLIKPFKSDEENEEEIYIFEPFNLSLKISGFENAKIFNLGNFIGEQPKFIPTEAPPPPPPLKKVQTTEEKKFIPTEAPPPPPPLKKVQTTEEKSSEKAASRFQFVPFVKGGMLEEEFKHANMIKMKNNEYDYFPKRKEEYMYTDVSLYSSADVNHSVKTAELISKYYDISNKTLTEASACIGGNSWSFADKVKNINLIEIDGNNFKALKHNMGVVFNKKVDNDTLEYKPGKTMKFFNDNYIKIKVEGDIIFYDPPWGGVDYKNEPQVGYTYNNKFYTIEDMAKKSFYDVPPELIVFRVPMTSNILESDYKYKTSVDFNDSYGKGIYKLIFLSDIKGEEFPGSVKVKRINYKKIEYDVI